MNSLNREVSNVQNPSIGAAVLWRFVCGYYGKEKRPVPFPLLFIVLPIIFRQDLCDVINSTQKGSGLTKVSEKLFKTRKNDRLYFVHQTAELQKKLTLESINIGIIAHLITLDMETAFIYPLTETGKKGVSISTKNLLSAADKLGFWCAGLTLLEISKALKVRF